MIPRKAHSLLSDIHALLGSYDAQDFISAARFSPELQDALELLAKKTGNFEKPRASTPRPSPVTVKAKARSGRRESKYSTPDEIGALLERADHLESPQSIISLAKRLGVNVAMNPKDGRARLLRRLANAIVTLGKDRRSEVVAELMKNMSSQTLGWIGVLKGQG